VNESTRDGDLIRWELGERRKELAALHGTARILQRHDRPAGEVLDLLVALLPGSWQYPEVTRARVEFGDTARATQGYRDTPWKQTESFATSRGTAGRIDVVYLDERPEKVEGPFLAEERDLIRSLADMLQTYFDHQEADAQVERARDRLEEKVRERTAELRDANAALERELEAHRRAEREIERQSARLRELSREVALAEERQRRDIARDLHDHLGQALAFLRMQLSQLQGDVMFSGVEGRLEAMGALLDKSIRYTRTLTAEISPPVLYELGFLPAIMWLADRMLAKYSLPVKVESAGDMDLGEEAVRVTLFLAIRELLVNAAKHAGARSVRVQLAGDPDAIRVGVRDDGVGFDAASSSVGDGFGLFSIAERIRSLGGSVDIESAAGRGTRINLSVPRGEGEL